MNSLPARTHLNSYHGLKSLNVSLKISDIHPKYTLTTKVQMDDVYRKIGFRVFKISDVHIQMIARFVSKEYYLMAKNPPTQHIFF